MSALSTMQAAWARFATISSLEGEAGFRDVILSLSRRGMLMIAALASGSVLFYSAAHFLFVGSTITFFFRQGDPPTTYTLWDNLIILTLCAACVVLARSRLEGRWGRLLIGLMALTVVLAFLFDDVARGTLRHSPMYLILVMLSAVGTMPFRPTQMLLLCSATSLTYLGFALYFGELMQMDLMAGTARRMIPLTIATIICTGISALLYRTRYEQYLARRRAETLNEELTSQSERLRELEQAKSRFFANVSHEFRTPLTLILGPLDEALQESGDEDSTLGRRLGIMRRSALRLQRLIDQLLDLSKLEAGRMDLRAREQDLIAFLRHLLLSFAPLADRRGIALHFHPDFETLRLSFDEEKMEKVITNLLSNAFKFTSSLGKVSVSVRVSTEDGDSYVSIAVRDTGDGIPSDKLAHIFDRFYQVDDSLSRGQEGTGIGLSLARDLVELHDGTLHAESERGFGSTFTVRLPLSRSAVAAQPESPPELLAEPQEQPAAARVAVREVTSDEVPARTAEADARDVPLVLLVDDNADMRAHLCEILIDHYRVSEAANGREGLERARALKPALIVSDVMMPELDGFALCRRLKTDDELRHIPIVLLTARAEESSKLEGLTVGADDYLYKPFSAPELLTRAENLIELRRALREYFSGRVSVQASDVTVSSAEATFLENVRTVIEAHIGDANFGVDWLADAVNLGPRQLQRRLQATLRLSAAGYIRLLRLQRAAQLLAQSAGTISEIAYSVGFHDPHHFSRLFKQTFGVTPSEYSARTTDGQGPAEA